MKIVLSNKFTANAIQPIAFAVKQKVLFLVHLSEVDRINGVYRSGRAVPLFAEKNRL